MPRLSAVIVEPANGDDPGLSMVGSLPMFLQLPMHIKPKSIVNARSPRALRLTDLTSTVHARRKHWPLAIFVKTVCPCLLP